MWRWVKSKGSGYLRCKAASVALRKSALTQCTVFQFASFIKDRDIYRKKKDEPTVVSVEEYGRGITFDPTCDTRVFLREFDEDDIVQMALRDQMAITLDSCATRALKDKPVQINISMLKRAFRSSTSSVEWNDMESLCRVAPAYLSHVNAPYVGESYIGIAGTKFLRNVKPLSLFRGWTKYIKEGDVLYLGEAGSTGNIRWIESCDSTHFLKDAVIFGAKGLLCRQIETPYIAIREDYQSVQWYGVLGCSAKNVIYIPPRKWA